jgi:uncharacterized DUF497 family protein
MEFEWDAVKESENIRKHGFAFADAVEAFLDPNGFALRDEKHSKTETRHYWVGRLTSGVVVTVRYTRRAGKVRIFGCAKWRNFRRLYDERAKAKKS